MSAPLPTLQEIQATPSWQFTHALIEAFNQIVAAQSLAERANESQWLPVLQSIRVKLAAILQAPPTPKL